MENKILSPILAQTLKINTPKMNNSEPQQAQVVQNQPAVGYSPLLTQAVLAQSKQILPKTTQVVGVTDAHRNVVGYKNDLKDMLVGNKANILAVIPRIMNAQDKDGNELIQGDEIPGNLVNAVERLDEIKDLGFNTQHVLPVHPPGKTKAMGTAGSLYAPALFVEDDGSLAIDPELVDENPPKQARKRIEEIYEKRTGKKLSKMDKNDVNVRFSQFAYYIEECHKRGIRVMLDLPSCASVDFAMAHPEMMAVGPDGKEKVPQGWQDIRMFKPFEDEQTRELNQALLDMHRKYVDACIDLGIDGIRADVGRAKPVEFWNVIIRYSHERDPQFGWLAETYTHEDASPQLNMPYDRPKELLEVGFDSYYGQYHIYNDWTKADQLYDYVKENIDMSNEIGRPKSLIGSFATHDDSSPMLYGGAPWVMFTTILQSMLPQVNPYMTDGVQTGDYYIFPYDHALVRDTQTDNNECVVHTGRMDIFNKSRKPGGKFPEISNVVKTAFSLRDNKYNEVNKNSSVKLEMKNAQDVITKGSFIVLPTNNPEIIAFARHKDGKTLLFIGNRNVNNTVGGKVQIPGLNPEQKFQNLMPNYGEECKFQNQKDGSVVVELGASRACVFEIDNKEIEALSKKNNILQQQYLK
ncbi:MAG: hypothetical protein IJ003_04875 [Candidatus Gastranaerophilales bacterium]|nr:hypothetical protein [Candidatus Gastranaerophilales bacterium]